MKCKCVATTISPYSGLFFKEYVVSSKANQIILIQISNLGNQWRLSISGILNPLLDSAKIISLAADQFYKILQLNSCSNDPSLKIVENQLATLFSGQIGEH